MNKFDEIVKGVQKLHERGYVYEYFESTDEDTGIRYMSIQIGEWTVSGAKGNGYKTIRKIGHEAKERGLYFEDHAVYNHVYVYEKNPLDVF